MAKAIDGGPDVTTAVPSAPRSTAGPETSGTARCTPGTCATCSARERATGVRSGTKFASAGGPWDPCSVSTVRSPRTYTSALTVVSMIASKVPASIDRNANVPTTNATPIVTARTERLKRTKCSRTPRRATRITAVASGCTR